MNLLDLEGEVAVELLGGPADGAMYLLDGAPLVLFVDRRLVGHHRAGWRRTAYYLTGEFVHGDWLVMRPDAARAVAFRGFRSPAP